MIDYTIYDLPEEMKNELMDLEVEFVFQPIFNADMTLCAYEALMRPGKCSIIDLISKYQEKGRLHILEVATFFGAFQEYERRGYTENVCVNSFPTEAMTDEECSAFNEAFQESKYNGIIEILEYPPNGELSWEEKKSRFSWNDLYLAVDDFGSGSNDMTAVEKYKPQIVKLDRSLISDIDADEQKRTQCKEYIDIFHEKGILALGEGIETKGELDVLLELGIDLLQGFYLGMPE